MSKKEIHFMGLLANIDSSILNVQLDHGFKIHAISDREGATLISIFEGLPPMEIHRKLFMEFSCLSEKKFYFISNSFNSDIEMNDKGILANFPSEEAEFDNNLVHGYLNPAIRLMRLFKEGNICMPLKYYYFIDNNIPKSFMHVGTTLHVSPGRYTLGSSEISALQRFIKDTKLPFKESFLQLAFENFELSYQTQNINLSFLSLMISLETLFNPGAQELTYRISRNTATLLGKDKGDSKRIFSEIKDLYGMRSNIVHVGKSDIINKEDLLKLRGYVRESIKEINKIGKNKDNLLDILNSCGFCERPWTK